MTGDHALAMLTSEWQAALPKGFSLPKIIVFSTLFDHSFCLVAYKKPHTLHIIHRYKYVLVS